MRFSDIPGHEDVKQRLREMVDNNRLPHSLLLHGQEGAGKLMLARALVTYLHCQNRQPDGDSCGKCPSCLQHASHNHVDTHYSFPTIKKKSDDPGFSSDFSAQWKEFLDEDPYADIKGWLDRLGKPNGQPVIYRGEAEALSKKLGFTARSSEYKTAIIWLPERFNREAANKLLKLIEEPFPDTKLIFISNDSRSILPTIFSRLQRIEVKPLKDAEVADILISVKPEMNREEAEDIATVAAGNVHAARDMVDGASDDAMLREFIALMRHAYQRKIGLLKKWADNMASTGREAEMKFLDYCCRMMRENFMTNTGIPGITRLRKNEREFSSKFSKFINSRNVLPLIKEFEKAKADISMNGNGKIIFFHLSIRVILLIKN